MRREDQDTREMANGSTRPGYCRLLLTLTLVAVGTCCGCALNDQGDPCARDTLIRAMRPIAESQFIVMNGIIQRGRCDERSFLLVFGPGGKYRFSCDRMTYFSDGQARGFVDESVVPAVVSMDADVAECTDAAMAVGMLGGPYPFALARVTSGDQWLRSLTAPDSVYEERRLSDGLVEVIVVDQRNTQRFAFRGAAMLPVRYSLEPSGGSADDGVQIAFSKVEYPSAVPERVFRSSKSPSSGPG